MNFDQAVRKLVTAGFSHSRANTLASLGSAIRLLLEEAKTDSVILHVTEMQKHHLFIIGMDNTATSVYRDLFVAMTEVFCLDVIIHGREFVFMDKGAKKYSPSNEVLDKCARKSCIFEFTVPEPFTLTIQK
jgi:hypothetical protein